MCINNKLTQQWQIDYVSNVPTDEKNIGMTEYGGILDV